MQNINYCQNRSQNVTKVTNLLHMNMDNSKGKKYLKFAHKTEGTIPESAKKEKLQSIKNDVETTSQSIVKQRSQPCYKELDA